jgi:cysteate synthase
MERHYSLFCVTCGKRFEDVSGRGFLLTCDERHGPSLLRARYRQESFVVRERSRGLFRYRDWLPVAREWDNRAVPAVFACDRLGRYLGMRHLTAAFSGYWPERGAFLESCSFKELEAWPVLARVPEGERRALVVSSAGNTGRAFLQVGSRVGAPVVVVVPEFAVGDMWLVADRHPEARLVALRGADYADSIRLGANLADLDGFFAEGGARNVARRDGMGTVLLAAVESLGELPEHYFQAVGSGTGAIAAWEMSRRLADDPRYAEAEMRLHLVQNAPFAPMTEAWLGRSRELVVPEETESRNLVRDLHSRVLANRQPPFAIAGGVYDALADTGGMMYSVTNREAAAAGALFEKLEGCDLDPAAEIALAGLMGALRAGTLDPAARVLVNLTGGGKRRLERDRKLIPAEPDCTLDLAELGCPERIQEALEQVPVAV